MEKVLNVCGEMKSGLQRSWIDFKKQLNKRNPLEPSQLFSFANHLNVESYLNSNSPNKIKESPPKVQIDLNIMRSIPEEKNSINHDQKQIEIYTYSSPSREHKPLEQLHDKPLNFAENKIISPYQIEDHHQQSHQQQQAQIHHYPLSSHQQPPSQLQTFTQPVQQQQQQQQQQKQGPEEQQPVNQQMERKKFSRENNLRQNTRKQTLLAKDDTSVPSKLHINLGKMDNQAEYDRHVDMKINNLGGFGTRDSNFIEEITRQEVKARVEAQDFLHIKNMSNKNSNESPIQLDNLSAISKKRISFQQIPTFELLDLLKKGNQLFDKNSQTLDLIHYNTFETTTNKNADQKYSQPISFADQVQNTAQVTLKKYSVFVKKENGDFNAIAPKIQDIIDNKVPSVDQGKKLYQL